MYDDNPIAVQDFSLRMHEIEGEEESSYFMLRKHLNEYNFKDKFLQQRKLYSQFSAAVLSKSQGERLVIW